MKENVSKNIYLISIVISFVAGLIALNATLGLYVACDATYGFESLGCVVGYVSTLVIVAPFVALFSLIIRLFARNEKNKRWEDIYVWALFIIIFSLLNTINQEISYGVLKLIIYTFTFLFLVTPLLIFVQKSKETKLENSRIIKRKLIKKKVSRKAVKKVSSNKKRK